MKDNSVTATKVMVKFDNKDEPKNMYLYGQSELLKNYDYDITLYKNYADTGPDVIEVINLYISYYMNVKSFQYDDDNMAEIFLLDIETRALYYFSIQEYTARISENQLLFEGFGGMTRIDSNEEQFNLLSMIGFDNISLEMFKDYLRKLNIIR